MHQNLYNKINGSLYNTISILYIYTYTSGNNMLKLNACSITLTYVWVGFFFVLTVFVALFLLPFLLLPCFKSIVNPRSEPLTVVH